MKYVTGLVLIFVLNIIPAEVQAQTGGLVTCNGIVDCNLCTFGELINNIINWLFGVLIVIAVIVLAVAGFRLVTSGGDVAQMQWAKQRILYVVIGFLLMLASWLIVDTVLRGLTGSQNGMAFWGSFDADNCGFTSLSQAIPIDVLELESGNDEVESFTGSNSGPPGTVRLGEGGISDAEARAYLEANGVEAKSGVSYEGLQPHVLERIVALDRACNCDVLVTSATDGTSHAHGTYSHYEGYKLDLRTRDNPELVSYIRNNFQFDRTWSNGTPVYKQGNTECAIEDTHLDCKFIP